MSIYRKLIRENAGLRFFFGITACVVGFYLLYLGIKEVYAYFQLLSYYRELEEAGEVKALGGAADLLFEAICYSVVVFGGAVVTVVWVIAEYFSEASIAIQKLIWSKRENGMDSSVERRLAAIEGRINTIVRWFGDVETLGNRVSAVESELDELEAGSEPVCSKGCCQPAEMTDSATEEIAALRRELQKTQAENARLAEHNQKMQTYVEEITAYYKGKV